MRSRFVCYFYFQALTSLNLGISLDLAALNIEVHVPFGFFRVGLSSWEADIRTWRTRWMCGRSIGLAEEFILRPIKKDGLLWVERPGDTVSVDEYRKP